MKDEIERHRMSKITSILNEVNRLKRLNKEKMTLIREIRTEVDRFQRIGDASLRFMRLEGLLRKAGYIK